MRALRTIYGRPKKIGEGLYSLEVLIGSHIPDAIAEAIIIARDFDAMMQLELNGVIVKVRADSNSELINRDWSRAMSGFIGNEVGPYPRARLRKQDIAKDARIRRKSRREYKKSAREYHLKALAHRKAVEAKMINASRMEESSPGLWEKTVVDARLDPMQSGIVTYAERWARLMQLEMASGKKLEEVAEATSHEADLEGMSGYSYGVAVSILANCWRHGEQLRRWHNLDTQLGDEGEKANESGGVLNPALMNIGR